MRKLTGRLVAEATLHFGAVEMGTKARNAAVSCASPQSDSSTSSYASSGALIASIDRAKNCSATREAVTGVQRRVGKQGRRRRRAVDERHPFPLLESEVRQAHRHVTHGQDLPGSDLPVQRHARNGRSSSPAIRSATTAGPSHGPRRSPPAAQKRIPRTTRSSRNPPPKPRPERPPNERAKASWSSGGNRHGHFEARPAW